MKNEFMERAIELSRRNMNSNIGGPFGAVVVKGGKIVGEGWNEVTSINDPTAHAEIQAIRNACKNLNTFSLGGVDGGVYGDSADACEIYTSCEPCPMCLAAIYWARCKKIYYANTKIDASAIDFDDAFIYHEFALQASERSLPVEQIMRDDALKIFQIWKNKADKIPY